jgi:hypothetical protein
MRKILITAVAGAALAVAPALAAKPASKPEHPTQSHKGKTHSKAKAKGRCKVHTVGYNAKGTLVSQTLTQTKGADTATDSSDDRWSGDIVVNVTWANHKSPKGEQTFSLTDGKVAWYDAANDGTADPAVAGDKVRIHGKISKQAKKCNGTDSAAVVTIKARSAGFQQAAPAPAAPTT